MKKIEVVFKLSDGGKLTERFYESYLSESILSFTKGFNEQAEKSEYKVFILYTLECNEID